MIEACFLAEDGLPDDRVSCTSCSNFTPHLHRCRAFLHQPLVDIPRRCVQFIPLRSARDQRTGRERFPDIQAQIEELGRLDAAHAGGAHGR